MTLISQLIIVDCSWDGEALAIGIPEGVVTGETPRRSQKIKVTPKQNADYIGGDDLDLVLGVKKNTSPKDRKKHGIKAK